MYFVLALSVLVTAVLADEPSFPVTPVPWPPQPSPPLPTCPNQGIDPGFVCDFNRECNSIFDCLGQGGYCCEYGGCGDTRCEPFIPTPTIPTPGRPINFICYLPPDPGFCRGYIPRWYYDFRTGDCKEFIYGGCGGNPNNFRSHPECRYACGSSFPFSASGGQSYTTYTVHHGYKH